ncbi:MAG: Inner membrane protein YihY, formerly thought to be RNase BN [uncultured Cytophagales bacterium]|uniref:Inner membrane protein YihY, formerly thought to be RNase BN n=1 Tax=uncultured Cytophagales bacterium TaxID=158755 RepID=A0A6J4JH02_9SPHI|nr:MAG: Inner membrane protein YihY, formerly thought to be RNase BN [uncultured Cytophagales bacterium]
MKERLLKIWTFIKEMYAEWQADACFQLAAALSYYSVFSLAPIIVVAVSVAGYFFGRDAVTGEMYEQIRGLIGPDGATAIQKMVESAYLQDRGLFPTVIGLLTLLFSATIAFTALQDALNKIYKVQADPQSGIVAMVINRLLSFALVLAIGFLLMVSLTVDIIINVLDDYIQRILVDYSIYLIRAIQIGISFSIITLLFAMIFKFLPDVKIRWQNVWRGAILTAGLFTLGKSLIGLYLGQSDLTSTYGAAASIVIILLWVNYSSWILFIGAEYIYVYAKRRGEEILPSHYAKKIRYGRRESAVKAVDAPGGNADAAGRPYSGTDTTTTVDGQAGIKK